MPDGLPQFEVHSRQEMRYTTCYMCRFYGRRMT